MSYLGTLTTSGSITYGSANSFVKPLAISKVHSDCRKAGFQVMSGALAASATAIPTPDSIQEIVYKFTPTDYSGSIAHGGNAQQLIPPNANRANYRVWNDSNYDLWIRDDGTDAAIGGLGSIKISPGAYYESQDGSPGNTSVSIIGPVTGQLFSAQEGHGVGSNFGTFILTAQETIYSLEAIDYSGSLSSGTSAQTVIAANPGRLYLRLENTSGNDLWIRYDGTAAVVGGPGSYRVKPLEIFETEYGDSSGNLVSIMGSQAGQTYSMTEYSWVGIAQPIPDVSPLGQPISITPRDRGFLIDIVVIYPSISTTTGIEMQFAFSTDHGVSYEDTATYATVTGQVIAQRVAVELLSSTLTNIAFSFTNLDAVNAALAVLCRATAY